MHPRSLTAALVALAALGAAAGCSSTTESSTSSSSADSSAGSSSADSSAGSSASGSAGTSVDTAVEAPGTATTLVPVELRPVLEAGPANGSTPGTTAGEDVVRLEGRAALGESFVLGPPIGVDIVDRAGPQLNPRTGEWEVLVEFTDEGIEALDVIAPACVAVEAACPTGRVAIVVGDEVVSAPTVQTTAFTGTIVISGLDGQEDAIEVATALLGGGMTAATPPAPTRQ